MLGIARDDPETIYEKLSRGLETDAVVSSGGVSMGDYDFVRGVLERLGVAMRFWKVAVKPGKPLAFGMHGRKPIFGLPGNPGSSMISFHHFVAPALRKMSGMREQPRPVIHATLEDRIEKPRGRRHFLRAVVRYGDGRFLARLAGTRSSNALRPMYLANGLMIIPEEETRIEAGSEVRVELLRLPFGDECPSGWS
jgi:molybdopterin molybdotransferase